MTALFKLFFITLSVAFASARSYGPTCKDYYGPCDCTSETLHCSGISVSEIKSIFDRRPFGHDFPLIDLEISSFGSETVTIPDNFFNRHSLTGSLRIACIAPSFHLKIDNNAFGADQLFYALAFDGCNLNQQFDWNFLAGSTRLDRLAFKSSKGINNLRELPSSLTEISFEDCENLQSIESTAARLPDLNKLTVFNSKLDNCGATRIIPALSEYASELHSLDLASNALTKFEEDAFGLALNRMAALRNGEVNLSGNSFDCDCHLKWLIRDNRRYLPLLIGAVCSNGTSFQDLKPDAYEQCPDPEIFRCSPASNGIFPSNVPCANHYFACSNGGTYKKLCSCGLVFNEKLMVCDWPSNVASCSSNTMSKEMASVVTPLFQCPGSNGDFAAPTACVSYFYTCSNGTPYKMSCPGGLVFNNKTILCDWPRNIPGCT